MNGETEKQLTKDTGDEFLNGEVDWVYAEELAVRSNYFWSPDSKQIVFLQMDETRVPTYPITDWMPTHPGWSRRSIRSPAIRIRRCVWGWWSGQASCAGSIDERRRHLYSAVWMDTRRSGVGGGAEPDGRMRWTFISSTRSRESRERC